MMRLKQNINLMKAHNHCKSSVKKFGGEEHDYIDIHAWFDESKEFFGDIRHRALRHHAQGIFECERKFGITILNSDGKEIIVKSIAEQHVIEDIGFIPTLQDWFKEMSPRRWMASTKKVTKMNLS